MTDDGIRRLARSAQGDTGEMEWLREGKPARPEAFVKMGLFPARFLADFA